VNLGALFTRARSFLPAGEGGASTPAAGFAASEPGGASAPLIVLVIAFCAILAAIWASAGLFGNPAALAFCRDSLMGCAAVLGVLVPALLAYRSFNKHTAAKVVIAQAQGPQQAPASAVGTATNVTVEGKP